MRESFGGPPAGSRNDRVEGFSKTDIVQHVVLSRTPSLNKSNQSQIKARRHLMTLYSPRSDDPVSFAIRATNGWKLRSRRKTASALLFQVDLCRLSAKFAILPRAVINSPSMGSASEKKGGMFYDLNENGRAS
ncbi:hypothetical protein AVEN_88947-1 [Araneus ventricosus]|uniref:Uncharacterized protein n=1 Tax=Araneus ventricosus TaxID=182803 RepID=A0A4Y2DIT4_ARAVE|nr:hypothetical protein AVEN_88947-1 [Araneus ventricosus]